MEYYIFHDQRYVGPYDLMSMLRKIRHGVVAPHTMIATESGAAPSHAIVFAEFSELFDDLQNTKEMPHVKEFAPLSFFAAVRGGGHVLKMNMGLTASTGLFILLAMGGAAALALVLEKAALAFAAAAWSYFAFALYQCLVLHKSRMQRAGPETLLRIVRKHGLSLLLCSSFIGVSVFAVPMWLSWRIGPEALMLILLPGSVMLLLFFFAPLLVADRRMHPLTALGRSASVLFQSGLDNMLTLYLLLIMNFIAAATIFLLPVVLPITLAAMSEIYDDYFNEHG